MYLLLPLNIYSPQCLFLLQGLYNYLLVEPEITHCQLLRTVPLVSDSIKRLDCSHLGALTWQEPLIPV